MMTVVSGFETFFREAEPRLRRAFPGRLSPEHVADAVSAALEFAWVHWDRVGAMEYPVAYLLRVGLSKSRGRLQGRVPASPPHDDPLVEPALIPAMQRLPGRQREVVWLVEACGWSPTETAEALGLSLSAVRTHRARGLERLCAELGVDNDA